MAGHEECPAFFICNKNRMNQNQKEMLNPHLSTQLSVAFGNA